MDYLVTSVIEFHASLSDHYTQLVEGKTLVLLHFRRYLGSYIISQLN